MKSTRYNPPQLYSTKAGEISISGKALITLITAVFEKGVPFRFKARGWSMTPFIRDGDIITMTRVNGNPLKIGEVVAFIHPENGKLIVHRVIRAYKETISTQGDSVVKTSDGIIPRTKILGKVSRVERNNRDIWLGLGPERVLIAWLSRARILNPFYLWMSNRFGGISTKIDKK